MSEGVAFYNIKLETVKTVAYEELLSDAVELKHDNDVVDLPPVKIEATSTTCAVVKKNWKHPGTNSLKLLTQSNECRKTATSGEPKRSTEKCSNNVPPKKSRLQIKSESTLFDTAHVCKLVKSAFKFYDLNVSEFAAFVLKETDSKFVDDLLENPKTWTVATERERHLYKQMSQWLQQPFQDRIVPVNSELRRLGLPEKVVSDPEVTDASTRKHPKSKSGFRYTSDLLTQLRSELHDLDISLSDFVSTFLGGSGGILNDPPRLLEELDSEVLPIFLQIQQWLCLPKEIKLEPFKQL